MADLLLELIEISKSYPGVQALSNVSFSLAAGEVVGLVGENGAGKSTLMNVLGGVVAPSAGVISINGRESRSLTVREAIAAGIAFVHQEPSLFDNLDVAANVLFGREPLWAGPLKLVDRRRLRDEVQPLLERLGCDFSPETSVADLSIAQRQLLEIAKALSLEARILILDEPTSSLTVTETNRLIEIVRGLEASGVGVIFITHRLHEIEQCADRVVVLRDGRVTGHLDRASITRDAMIRLMIGRDLKALYNPPAAAPGETVLDLAEVRTAAYPDRKVNLRLRKGEILGLAGLVGAGRTELARAVFGIDALSGGAIALGGEPIRIAAPFEAIAHGLYLVPEDRKRSGLLLDVSVTGNISLANLPAFAFCGLVDSARETRNAEAEKRKLNIKTPTLATPVGSLSGGNQQKVVLAKWLSMQPRAIIFDEPTRGIDVGAKAEIYALMRGLADAGVAILMISSDLEEVIGVSDRVAVMHEGAISGMLDRDDFDEEAILRLATGAPVQGAASSC